MVPNGRFWGEPGSSSTVWKFPSFPIAPLERSVTSKPAPNETRDPNRIAVLLPHGEGWTAVSVERTPDGWGFRSQHDAGAGFEVWLSQAGTGRILVVLPARETVCRTFSLPAASQDQLDLALRLQAEAALLGGVPPHRVGLGILPAAADAKVRQGLVLAWPESMATAELPEFPAGIPTTFVPELAGLSALAVSDGPRSGITMAADRTDGSVVLIVPTGGGDDSGTGLAIRSTREDGSEPDSWRDSLLRAARETLISSDIPVAAAEAMVADFARRMGGSEAPRTIVVPEETERLVERTLPGAESLDRSARTAVAGVLLAVDGPLAPFTRLLREIPRERPHPIQAAIDRLSEPRLAGRILIAAVLVVMLGPLAFASMRYGILSLKVDDLDTLERSNRITRQQVAMYRELRSNAWPMGKVLGDLANAMPEGVDAETISIGQSEGVTVRGIAKPSEVKLAGDRKESLDAAEVVGRMQRDLEDSGIFRRAKYEFKAEDGRGWREFTMTCEVTAPTRQPSYTPEEDYAVRTLRDRRYPNWREIEGSEAGSAAPPDATRAAADPRVGTPPPPRDPLEEDSGSEEASGEGEEESGEIAVVAEGDTGEATDPNAAAAVGASRGIGRRPTGPRAAPGDGSGGETPPQPTAGVNVEVPPAMTDEEIAALSKSDALALLNRVAKARQSPSIDQDTKTRLRADFDRLMQHIRKAP
jgi:hypothetical protein